MSPHTHFHNYCLTPERSSTVTLTALSTAGGRRERLRSLDAAAECLLPLTVRMQQIPFLPQVGLDFVALDHQRHLTQVVCFTVLTLEAHTLDLLRGD